MTDIKTQLLQHMAERNLNQADVARMVGVSESTVGRWLKTGKGGHGITRKNAQRIRFVLGCDLLENAFVHSKHCDAAKRCVLTDVPDSLALFCRKWKVLDARDQKTILGVVDSMLRNLTREA